MNDIFAYNIEFNGGTEQMVKSFLLNILPEKNIFYKYNCIVIPGQINFNSFIDILKDDKEIILWMHNSVEQFDQNIRFMLNDLRFLKKLKFLIVVSEWHKKNILETTDIPDHKILVVYNYVNSGIPNLEKFKNIDKIKIINTSMAPRYIDALMPSLKYINSDFEFHIFSDINPDSIPEDIKKTIEGIDDERLFFHGKSSKKVLNKYLNESHIYAYPGIWEETFCLSIVEAATHNCVPVYNAIAALPEILDNTGIVYIAEYERINYGFNYENLNRDILDKHAKIFASSLDFTIEMIKNNKIDFIEYSKKIAAKYSKENFIKSWNYIADNLL